ncbi:hypothetical protein GCM10009730_58870 [Streptomyces albidochromogenes]
MNFFGLTAIGRSGCDTALPYRLALREEGPPTTDTDLNVFKFRARVRHEFPSPSVAPAARETR